MAVIQDIIAALWQHDFAALADPHIVSVVYFVMFATLFLENGLLPASFLPGDSLLLKVMMVCQSIAAGQDFGAKGTKKLNPMPTRINN